MQGSKYNDGLSKLNLGKELSGGKGAGEFTIKCVNLKGIMSGEVSQKRTNTT